MFDMGEVLDTRNERSGVIDHKNVCADIEYAVNEVLVHHYGLSWVDIPEAKLLADTFNFKLKRILERSSPKHTASIRVIEDLGEKLYGEVFDHPNFGDGEKIMTSRIVNRDGDKVETWNRVYTVLPGPLDITPFT